MTQRDKNRYSRQILFDGIGEEGQQRLLESRAVVVGCGALGTLQASALVRAGIGEVVIIDRDYVEESNLQRQWLFDEEDAANGVPKAAAAASKLRRANSGGRIEAVIRDLTAENAEDLLLPAGVVVDGTDNFEVRYLINDVAVKHGVPWIYGAAVGSYGSVMPVLPGQTACLACIFPEPPSGVLPTCDTAGVLNAITSLIASLQVAEALKILSGRVDAVSRRLLSIDIWENTQQAISTARRDEACPVCDSRKFRHLERSDRPAVSLCGRDAVQVHERRGAIDLIALGNSLAALGQVKCNGQVLRFSCPPYELTVFDDGRAIIKGTQDIGVARSLYARYIGA